jgi:hypothetical protein
MSARRRGRHWLNPDAGRRHCKIVGVCLGRWRKYLSVQRQLTAKRRAIHPLHYGFVFAMRISTMAAAPEVS